MTDLEVFDERRLLTVVEVLRLHEHGGQKVGKELGEVRRCHMEDQMRNFLLQ